MRRALTDDNRRLSRLKKSHYSTFVGVVGIVLMEYSLLQVAKLHDPAVMGQKITLSLDYVLKYGGWESATSARLQKLKTQLDGLLYVKGKRKMVKEARHEVLAHNDLAAHLSGDLKGAFTAGADKRYFRALHKFLEVAYRDGFDEPCGEFGSLTDDTRFAVESFFDSIKARDRKVDRKLRAMERQLTRR